MQSSESFLQKGNSLPHAKDAEQCFLGALLVSFAAFEKIEDLLQQDDFYFIEHKIIYTAILDLVNKDSGVDIYLITKELESKNKLEEVGGYEYLAQIADITPSAINIKTYGNLIKQKAIQRDVTLAGQKISMLVNQEEKISADELITSAENIIFDIAQKRLQANSDGPIAINPILKDTIAKMKELSELDLGAITGISSGFLELDKRTSGFQSGDLVVIAARPSMGKTTFAMNICENVANKEEKPVLVFSLEMPREQIVMRMLASLSPIDQTKVRTGQLKNDDWGKLGITLTNLKNNCKLFIDDSSSLNQNDIRTRARKIAKSEGGLSMIMIDYLQLMNSSSKTDNRTQEISEITRALKAIAKELKIPVIVLSQLNRSLEGRADKRPINSDLRESGAIEQDADLIMFLYRDEVYYEDSEDKGVAEIIIGKQRNGPIGTLRVNFEGQYSRFKDQTEDVNKDEYEQMDI